MKENASQVEVKETWSKPELEAVSIKESTLGTFINIGADNGVFS